MKTNIERSITTIEDAWALPEVNDPYFDNETEVLASGETVIHRKPRKFVPQPTSGDQILFFVDSDGRSMQVCYTENGPAKCECHY